MLQFVNVYEYSCICIMVVTIQHISKWITLPIIIIIIIIIINCYRRRK